MAFYEEFKRLKIQLEDVKSATDNFAENKVIGKGGFGKVYKGEILHSRGESMAAFKRLDSRLGQGNSEFWKEIMMLSRYTHEHLVSLLGYCDELGEKILIYEHASRGSLDRHLRTATLTWIQRIKICLAAARGLSYLHDHQGSQQRVLHRDIKSANILLDEKWNAKVSDLGLSKIGPANQTHTLLISNAVGTPGYCDPLYMEMGFLTKESDVYSFGVVLFEVLCGRLCFEFSNGQHEILVRMWKQKYELKKLDDIIFQSLMEKMDPSSLTIFSDIAYQCLHGSREERPTMARVVEELEIALAKQEIYEGVEQPKDYEAVITTAVPPLIYRSKEELEMLLSKGILVDGGKTWFSLNKNGEHCAMISAAKFLSLENRNYGHFSKENSRFADGSYKAYSMEFEARIKTRLILSPQITYTVNLVFKYLVRATDFNRLMYLSLKYKLERETKSSIAYLAHERDDGWMMVELCRFTSDKKYCDLVIKFEGTKYYDSLTIEGIEFRPVEKKIDQPQELRSRLPNLSRVEHEVVEEKKVDRQPLTDSDKEWEPKLPNDYEEIVKWSKDSMEWTTKKELYFLFCKGFLINNGEELLWSLQTYMVLLIYKNTYRFIYQQLFSLAKNGKKCPMLSARAFLVESDWTWETLRNSGSRFEEVAVVDSYMISFSIACKIKSQILSPQTTYVCYLIYMITDNFLEFEAPLEVTDQDFRINDYHLAEFWFIYLISHPTPVIMPNLDQHTHNRSNRSKMKGLQTPVIIPKLDQNSEKQSNRPEKQGRQRQRYNPLMEVQLWEFQTGDTTEMISMNFNLKSYAPIQFKGLVVQGIEFKPM